MATTLAMPEVVTTPKVAHEQSIRVIIVDDHKMLSEGTARLLAGEEDIEVVGTAATVADARVLVADTAPDVAIVDFRLPDGDGAALTREILAVSPTTKVLILTGLPDDGLLVAAIEAGCSGFLTKDRAIEELAAAVRLAGTGEAFIPTSLINQLLPKMRGERKGLGSDLTARELEILRLLQTGMTSPVIASTVFLSVNTVRNHVQNILMKLNAHSRLEAVSIANREGLLDR